MVQKQPLSQNIIQHPMTTENQVMTPRLQQNGRQSGYQYVETTNGVFLGQVPPTQSLPNDPLRF